MEKVCEYEGSSLWGMNGGQPESPDGTLLVYAKKPDLKDKEKQTTEIWICDRNTLGLYSKLRQPQWSICHFYR